VPWVEFKVIMAALLELSTPGIDGTSSASELPIRVAELAYLHRKLNHQHSRTQPLSLLDACFEPTTKGKTVLNSTIQYMRVRIQKDQERVNAALRSLDLASAPSSRNSVVSQHVLRLAPVLTPLIVETIGWSTAMDPSDITSLMGDLRSAMDASLHDYITSIEDAEISRKEKYNLFAILRYCIASVNDSCCFMDNRSLRRLTKVLELLHELDARQHAGMMAHPRSTTIALTRSMLKPLHEEASSDNLVMDIFMRELEVPLLEWERNDSAHDYIVKSVAPFVLLVERVACCCIKQWAPHLIPADPIRVCLELNGRGLSSHRDWFLDVWNHFMAKFPLAHWIRWIYEQESVPMPFIRHYKFDQADVIQFIKEFHHPDVSAKLQDILMEGLKLLDELITTMPNPSLAADTSSLWTDCGDSEDEDEATLHSTSSCVAADLVTSFNTTPTVAGDRLQACSADAACYGPPYTDVSSTAPAEFAPPAGTRGRRKFAQLRQFMKLQCASALRDDRSLRLIVITIAPVALLLQHLASFCILDWRPHRIPADPHRIILELISRELGHHATWFEKVWNDFIASFPFPAWVLYLCNQEPDTHLPLPQLGEYSFVESTLFAEIRGIHDERTSDILCHIFTDGNKLLREILSACPNPHPVTDTSHLWVYDDCDDR
jgi:hypothetical protein